MFTRLSLPLASFLALSAIVALYEAPAEEEQDTVVQQEKNNMIELFPRPLPRDPNARPRAFGIVYVSIVEIEAAVTDKAGNAIPRLTQENFKIDEDGSEEMIGVMSHFATKEASRADDSAEKPITISLSGPNNSGKLEVDLLEHRLIVLFFDKTSLQQKEMERAVHAAAEFVRGQMTPADLVAVVSLGTRFVVNADFTNDREALGKSIASLVPCECPERPEMARIIGDTENVSSNGIIEAFLPIASANRLAALVGRLPGRKSIVQFSSGAALTEDQYKSSEEQFLSGLNIAGTTAVSFYEVDMREALKTGTQDDIAAQSKDRQGSRRVLARLAAATDGKLFTDARDFRPVFDEVLAKSRDYYLLGFYSTNTSRDGKFHRVSVKLVKVPDGHVEFRTGYYAPKFGM